MSALRDLAVTIRGLNNSSPELDRPRQLFIWLKQRAVDAIAEDDAVIQNSAKYRTGGTDVPSNPCLIYLKGATPPQDTYMCAAPTGLMATMIVNALNALPPAP